MAKHKNTSNITNSADSELRVDEFLDFFLDTNKMHVKSLISTLFGDLAIPHGGSAWVETIASLLEPLGVSNRRVRTSLFRLVEEQWVIGTRSGRKSFYQLTDKALGQTRLAEKLIYYANKRKWDGRWTLIFVVQLPPKVELRNQLEQELKWMGFGRVAKHVYAHPSASVRVVAERVKALDLSDNVICMSAENLSDGMAGLNVSSADMAQMCFPATDLAQRYLEFINCFSQLDLATVNSSSPANQLLLRLLLIDEYRRIILHDPHLPVELLPDDWVGDQAHALCTKIYKSLFAVTNQWYQRTNNAAGEQLTVAFIPEYAQRFKK